MNNNQKIYNKIQGVIDIIANLSDTATGMTMTHNDPDTYYAQLSCGVFGLMSYILGDAHNEVDEVRNMLEQMHGVKAVRDMTTEEKRELIRDTGYHYVIPLD